MENKLFTKSAFKLALECPTKLFYSLHSSIYANQNMDDDFLQSLAEGGFQVGELAKLYRHVDYDLSGERGYEVPLTKTNEYLQQDNVTIAEAAFRFGDMFVRADVLEKRGNHINLIEVKAKSFDPTSESFMGKRDANSTDSALRPYLYDVAFQKYVVSQAMPGYQIHAYLMMADKSKTADVDNLNQLFKIVKVDGRPSIIVHPEAEKIIAQSQVPVLTAFDVDDLCDRIIRGETSEQESYMGMPFQQFVTQMAAAYVSGTRQEPYLGSKCFNCQFRKGETSLQDGHDQCWREAAHFTESDFLCPQVAELWGGARPARGQWVENGKYFLKDITFDDFSEQPKTIKPNQKGLNANERTWLQIGLATKNPDLLRRFADDLHGNSYIDLDGLRQEMDTWTYPLHMIDFETTAVALPYYAGMRPYEQVAFQFSHHTITLNPDGTYAICHAGQYLNEDVNRFPNFEFLRELKRQLSQDNGTVFRYAAHENTILNKIREQLQLSQESDRDELIAFIDTITHDDKTHRCGERDMVDLLDIVKKYYYNYDEMHGSNSIKKVLPAVLNSSEFLQHKYSHDIYGNEIPSLNIPSSAPKHWIEKDPDGRVKNPYHLLDSVASFLGITQQEEWDLDERKSDDDLTVANGGAALTAYSKLMFCDGAMSDALRTALLRYCELDTMAMVFIWEYFYHAIQ